MKNIFFFMLQNILFETGKLTAIHAIILSLLITGRVVYKVADIIAEALYTLENSNYVSCRSGNDPNSFGISPVIFV